jgi:hypothetical protein
MDRKLPMKSPQFWDNPTQMYQPLLIDNDDSLDEDIDCDCFDAMMDAKYEKVNTNDVATSQTHLSSIQQT